MVSSDGRRCRRDEYRLDRRGNFEQTHNYEYEGNRLGKDALRDELREYLTNEMDSIVLFYGACFVGCHACVRSSTVVCDWRQCHG